MYRLVIPDNPIINLHPVSYTQCVLTNLHSKH